MEGTQIRKTHAVAPKNSGTRYRTRDLRTISENLQNFPNLENFKNFEISKIQNFQNLQNFQNIENLENIQIFEKIGI